MDKLPAPTAPITRELALDRQLSPATAVAWLKAGWVDFKSVDMIASLLYGVFVFLLSMFVIGGLFWFDADYAFFPALGAFLVIGPALAIGLYEKSRRLQKGEPISIDNMMFVRSKIPNQLIYIGVILLLLCLLWMRAAVLVYALFFGMHQFPGFSTIFYNLVSTPEGWGLLLVGSLFGGLFAAFGFAISALSVPMLLNERIDAFTAMGGSITLIWHNLPVMLAWGVIVMVLFIISTLTGLLALIVIFPVLGHATWHAYVAIRGDTLTPLFLPAIAETVK